ncbi:hypothetical protein L3Q82_006088 [Scortum barcoo]|uniref:Uncharacterized protein n=1 Tax=Scortum barcoo TaxID=214431 RepID=A0ACB8X2G3_9TELE|nr:hypothetical protein L3Q82_006088 [Scortum barcoo]
MLKVTGSAMPGVVSLLWPGAVFAAAAGGEADTAAPPPAPLHRDELSLYAAAPRQEPRYVEPEAGQLEQSVAAFRKSVEPYTERCQGAYGQIKPKVQAAVRFGTDAFEYLQNPPKDFYPRAGVISFSGVLGLFLARGSRIKKLIYPAGLVAVSAALYYPEQAVVITRSTRDTVYDRAVQGYAALERMLKSPGEAERGAASTTKP